MDRFIDALYADVESDTAPLAFIGLATASVLSVEIVKFVNVSPPELNVRVPAPLLETVPLPVVLSVKVGVEVIRFISPEPELAESDWAEMLPDD